MASVGLLGVFVPGNPIRYLQEASDPIPSWGWNRALGFTANRGGQGVRICGFGRRLQERHLSGDYSRTCTTGKEEWCDNLISIDNMARRRRWESERTLHSQSFRAIQALEERDSTNGSDFGVCVYYPKGRPFSFYGHQSRLPTLSAGTSHEGLVHFQIPWSILPICGAAFWLGSISVMVHSLHEHLRQGFATNGISSFGVFGRLSYSSHAVWCGCDHGTLQAGQKRGRQAPQEARTEKESRERKLGGLTCSRTPRCDRRQYQYEVLGRTTEDQEGQTIGEEANARSQAWTPVGKPESSSSVLCCLRFTYFGYAMGPILYTFVVLGHVLREAKRQTEQVSPKPPEHPRFDDMAAAVQAGFEWAPNAPNETRCFIAYGCCRSWLWRDGPHKRLWTGSTRRVFDARHLELEGPSQKYYVQGTESSKKITNGIIRRRTGSSISEKFTFTRRQPFRRTYRQFLCVSQSPYDARAAKTQTHPGPQRHPDQDGMAAIRGQQIRRRTLATLPPRRPTDTEAAQALRAGWYEGTDRCIQVSPTRRASGVFQTTSLRRTRSNFESTNRSVAVPTSRLDRSHSDEVGTHGRASVPDDPGLAETALACSGHAHGVQSGTVTTPSRADLGGSADVEPALASVAPGGQSRVTRSMARLDIAQAGAERVATVAGATPGAVMTAELVADFAWSTRTTSARNSQWRAYVAFCEDEHRAVFSVTEAHLFLMNG